MQKQWSVEVVWCTNEWANNLWNAHETTWKSSCTSHWTIFHSFCHAGQAQHVAGKYVWQFLHKQTHKQFMQNQKKPNMSPKKCRPILELHFHSRYLAAALGCGHLLHGHTPNWTNQSVCRYLPCPQQSSQGQPICQTKIIGIHDMFFKWILAQVRVHHLSHQSMAAPQQIKPQSLPIQRPATLGWHFSGE